MNIQKAAMLKIIKTDIGFKNILFILLVKYRLLIQL